MARIDLIRTTAFRLAPEHFGKVHIYRPGPRFTRTWQQLWSKWRKHGDTSTFKRLPYRGLATALRVLSGDFVALQRNVEKERAFVLSRRPIDPAQLEAAVHAWEVHALGIDDSPISDVLDDLTYEVIDVAEQIHRRPGRCPRISDDNRWVWDAAIWEAAHRLAQTPMKTDAGTVSFRLDSDAALLTWNALVQRDDRDDSSAMHKVALNLITIPGVEEPVLSLQSSLVRLAPSWKATGGARYAWADLKPNAPILRGRVINVRRPTDDGSEEKWETLWADRATEVLTGASLDPLPNPSAGPMATGSLRTGYAKQPKRHGIGRGVGIWFHECLAHHARETLGPATTPLELEGLNRSSWPTEKTAAPRFALGIGKDKSEPEIRFLVVYAQSSVRRRVRDALAQVLKDDAHEADQPHLDALRRRLETLSDDDVLRVGPIEFQFIKPPGARERLLSRTDGDELERWVDQWLPSIDETPRVAALVETDEKAANGSELADPKHELRGALGKRGIVTQFITEASAPARHKMKDGKKMFNDHAAANAVNDAMRSAGYFLRPFPNLGVERGTLVVGVYATRVMKKTSGKKKPSFLVNLVAVSAGEKQAWGYTENGGWQPLDQATAGFVSSDGDHADKQSAADLVKSAVGQIPLVFGQRPTVLLLDAYGCRRFWPCLADKSTSSLSAWMKRGGTAVVRVRTATREVPRPAGVEDWDSGFIPARHTSFRPMGVKGAQGRAPTFVLSGSAVMSTGRRARESTRLAAPDKALAEDWHALGATEILVLEPGSWQPDELTEQVAMLCRIAPTWDRTLRWPSPLHLARAIVRDHPHQYFVDGEAEEEEVEDGQQLRFDFGIWS